MNNISEKLELITKTFQELYSGLSQIQSDKDFILEAKNKVETILIDVS